MPTDGQVGGGHQNKYRPEGEILRVGKKLQFSKGDVKPPISRDQRPCWSAGTPVEWPPNAETPGQPGKVDGTKVTIITKPCERLYGGTIDMLWSRGASPGENHYHPLIMFYNQIMADIINQDMFDDLCNLDKQKSAARLWDFLERRYLKKSEPDETYVKFLIDLYKAQLEDKLRTVIPPEEDVYDSIKTP